MPTLPMLIQPPGIEEETVFASRRVFAPGGYEWWGVEARSEEGVSIQVDFHLGSIGRRGWKAYRRYLRNPTRRRPPLAGHWPMVCWRIHEREGLRLKGRHEAAPAAAEASAERFAVRIGPGRLERGDDAIRLKLDTHDGSSIDLALRPRWPARPHVEALWPAVENQPDHHWWSSDGVVHDVEGMVAERSDRGCATSFRGLGMCRYHWGVRPLGADVGWWMAMSVIEPDRLSIGDMVSGMRRGVVWNCAGMREVRLDVPGDDWSGPGLLRPAWPRRIGVGDEIRLSRPRRVESAFGYLWLAYRAEVGGTLGGAVADGVIRCPRWHDE